MSRTGPWQGALAALLLGCASGAPPTPETALVWPPPSSAAPAEVVWRGELTRLKPRGTARWLQAVTGVARDNGSPWQLVQPVAVALHGDWVYVVDSKLGVVLMARHDGSGARQLETPPEFFPVALAVASGQSSLLVADRDSGRVLAFTLAGEYVGEAVAAGVAARVGGIGACANGDILLTDAQSGSVVRLSADGQEVGRFAPPGAEALNLPTAVVESGDGSIWVLDTFNFRIRHLDATLHPVGSFGELGDGTGDLALPKGLVVDPDGHLYVSDARFDVVQIFAGDGTLLLVLGGRGSGRGEFWNPAGLAFDSNGNLAIADTGNRRVQLFTYRARSTVP